MFASLSFFALILLVERELEKETDPDVREEKNSSLRRLGLRTIPEKPASKDGSFDGPQLCVGGGLSPNAC